jgi:septal ring factor EnvC (AmiA/AmiB activator)
MSTFSNGQQKESDRLKKQQLDLQKKIEFTENLLQSTEDSKTELSKTIGLINNKISYRNELVNNINLQLKTLDDEIILLEDEVLQLEIQLNQLINQYKQMIVLAYKLRSNSASILFILSSENFNQANKRMEYMEQITKYRANQIRRINQTKLELEKKLDLLEQKREEQLELAHQKETEKNNYINDLSKKKEYITLLDSKQQELQQELTQQRKKEQDIKRAIDKAINKEIAEQRAKEKAKPKTVAETKETRLTNNGFEANKGRLPWPVSKGEVIKGYGKQPHPLHPGVYTYNNGIDITTVKGSTVRAVYSGVVSSVIIIPGAGKAIIIAHGNYRTIYSNLQESYVQKGDKVVAKQEIGSLLVNANGTMSDVHFEIRKITTEGQIKNLNPSYWLYK